MGPSVKIAFKDGAPTPAAEAFAKKAGVAVDALKTVTTPKGEYLAATTVKRGAQGGGGDCGGVAEGSLAGFTGRRTCTGGAGKPERFVRPVRWMVALLDAEVVPVEFAGIDGGQCEPYGHRVLHGDAPVAD